MTNPYIKEETFEKIKKCSFLFKEKFNTLLKGNHLIKQKGESLDFLDYKKYIPGDDIRNIDINLYKRFNKPYIKLKEDERKLNITIYFDTSSQIGFYRNKKNYCLSLLIYFSYIGVLSADSVSIVFLEENKNNKNIYKLSNKDNFINSIIRLDEIKFKGNSNIKNSIYKEEENTKSNGGLAIIISDFLTDDNWKNALLFLKEKKKQILLIQVLAKEELTPNYTGRYNLFDSNNNLDNQLKLNISPKLYKAYSKAITEIKENINKFSTKNDIKYLYLNPSISFEEVIYNLLGESIK